MVGLHERADGVQLHDARRLGRGHHAAVPAPSVLDHVVAALRDHAIGLLAGHEGADGLGGVGERGVGGVDLDLGEHGGRSVIDPAVQHLLAQGVLQVVADVALAHGNADRERARDVLLGVGSRELGHGLLDHAHLRAVAVRHHDLVALLDEVHDRARRVLDRLHLLRQVVAQGVATEGDDDSLRHLMPSQRKDGAAHKSVSDFCAKRSERTTYGRPSPGRAIVPTPGSSGAWPRPRAPRAWPRGP